MTLVLLDATTGEQRQLAAEADRRPDSIVWGPDASTLYFTRRRRGQPLRVPRRPARWHGDPAHGGGRGHRPLPDPGRHGGVRAPVVVCAPAARRAVRCPDRGPGAAPARQRRRRARDRRARRRRADQRDRRGRDAARRLARPPADRVRREPGPARRVRARRAARLVEHVALALEPAHPRRARVRDRPPRPGAVDRLRPADARPRLGAVGRHAVHRHHGRDRRRGRPRRTSTARPSGSWAARTAATWPTGWRATPTGSRRS